MVEILALLNLMMKLKCLKVALREWNKNIFGRMKVHIENLQDRIEGLEWDYRKGIRRILKQI